MTSVLAGFGALAAVIAVGWVAGRARILGQGAGTVLARLTYFVATPALLLLTLAEADPEALASAALPAGAGSALVCALLFTVTARWRWREPAPNLAIGAMASSYVNAGNLGIPIAVYVLGDASVVAPVLLFQVLVLAPVGLAVLAGPASRRELLTRPLRTPIVIGCAIGLALSAGGWQLPEPVVRPIELLAAPAVPAALLAYGLSLHGAPRPGTGERTGQVWLAVVLKAFVQPVLAYAIGRWVLGLPDAALLAVTVTSALPTAQNVFVYATTHDRLPGLARDVILLTTVLSVPVLVVVTVLLGGD